MVCSIGDSVEFLSDIVLKLSSRRVTPFPAEAGKVKLMVVYFMCPETDAVFVDREGKQWKSVDWHNMKQRLFAKDLEAQKINLALTGGLGHNDLRSLLGVICLSQNSRSLAGFNSPSLCQLVDTMYLPSVIILEYAQEVTRG